MPPAADPIRWQLIDGIYTTFAAMETETSDNYFYPPQEVAVMVPPLIQYLDDRTRSTETIYGLWVEDEDLTERTAGRVDKALRLFIEVATRYEPRMTDPFKQPDAAIDFEEEYRSKQIHDVEKVVHSLMSIHGGSQLNLYENWEILGNDAFQANAVRHPGWVLTQFETLIAYHSGATDPTARGGC